MQVQLKGHPNIIRLVDVGENSSPDRIEFLILTELCPFTLIDVLNSRRNGALTVDEITRIFYQTCKAVGHMHSQTPPIIHRDLKVGLNTRTQTLELRIIGITIFVQIENILFSEEGLVKLCDFGSATTKAYLPDHGWSANDRSMAEDEVFLKASFLHRTLLF